jgi:hypothetical protein
LCVCCASLVGRGCGRIGGAPSLGWWGRQSRRHARTHDMCTSPFSPAARAPQSLPQGHVLF